MTILLVLLIGAGARAGIVLPYMEDFDDMEVGSSFEDWGVPFGEIFGPTSSPFGESIPFSGNYLFVSGSQGQSAGTAFSEISANVDFSLEFYSLANPNYDPPSAFRGGAQFLITAASEYSRDPQVGVSIHGEMWEEPDDLSVYFLAEYLDGSSRISVPIGTIGHAEIYSLSIAVNPSSVNVRIVGPSTDIQYEYILDQIFWADGIVLWEGSYPGDQYGVGIDNMIVIPEPGMLLMVALGGVFLRKRK